MDRLIFVIDLILWRCNESDPYNPSAFIDSISPIIYGIRLEFWQCYGIKDPYQNLHQAMHHAASLKKKWDQLKFSRYFLFTLKREILQGTKQIRFCAHLKLVCYFNFFRILLATCCNSQHAYLNF